MKKIKQVAVEVKNEIVDEQGGLVDLLGKKVCIIGSNYIYAGTLVGVNTTCVALEDCGIVYETGAWDSKQWKNCQKLPTKTVYVQTSAIESIFESEK